MTFLQAFIIKALNIYCTLLADHYASIAECDENNNTRAKLIMPCTNANNSTLSCNYRPGLIAANGYFTLNIVTADANTVFTGSVISGNPKLTVNANNLNLIVDTYLQQGFLPNNSVQNIGLARIAFTKKPDDVEFIESKDSNSLTYKINIDTIVSMSILYNRMKVYH